MHTHIPKPKSDLSSVQKLRKSEVLTPKTHLSLNPIPPPKKHQRPNLIPKSYPFSQVQLESRLKKLEKDITNLEDTNSKLLEKTSLLETYTDLPKQLRKLSKQESQLTELEERVRREQGQRSELERVKRKLEGKLGELKELYEEKKVMAEELQLGIQRVHEQHQVSGVS